MGLNSGDGVCAAIPMKPLAHSKMRLASALAPPRRAALSLWMLERVCRTVRTAGLGNAVVLGGDRTVQTLAAELGVQWQDPGDLGLNAALNQFYARLGAAAPGRLLYLAADLPLIESRDIESLLNGGDADIVLAAGARGGTNGLVVRTGRDFVFELGEDSLAQHQRQASAKRLQFRVIERAALEADLDLPEDLHRLEQRRPNLWDEVSPFEERLPQDGRGPGGDNDDGGSASGRGPE